jgi:hypothetical protein
MSSMGSAWPDDGMDGIDWGVLGSNREPSRPLSGIIPVTFTAPQTPSIIPVPQQDQSAALMSRAAYASPPSLQDPNAGLAPPIGAPSARGVGTALDVAGYFPDGAAISRRLLPAIRAPRRLSMALCRISTCPSQSVLELPILSRTFIKTLLPWTQLWEISSGEGWFMGQGWRERLQLQRLGAREECSPAPQQIGICRPRCKSVILPSEFLVPCPLLIPPMIRWRSRIDPNG